MIQNVCWNATTGVARIIAARMCSTVASNSDDICSHRPLLQYVTLKPSKLTTRTALSLHKKMTFRPRAVHLYKLPLN